MISQECSLGVYRSKLLKSFHFAEQDGRKSLKQQQQQKKKKKKKQRLND